MLVLGKLGGWRRPLGGGLAENDEEPAAQGGGGASARQMINGINEGYFDSNRSSQTSSIEYV